MHMNRLRDSIRITLILLAADNCASCQIQGMVWVNMVRSTEILQMNWRR